MGFRSLILLAIAFVLWSFPRLALAQDYSLAAVRAAFSGSSVVPDVLPRLNNLFFLDIVYTMPSTGRKIHVHTGGNFTKPETNYRPVFSIRSNNPAYNKRIEDQSYVIIGIDPDAPTPQNRTVSDVVHFLGGGFRVSGTVTAGQASVLTNVTPAIHDYAPPNPPDFSQAHRYVWLLYNETRGFMSQTFVNKTTSRRNFNLTAFVEATGMRRPIGGTFFYASTNPAEVGNGTLIAPTPVPTESSAAGTSVPLPFSSAWTFFVVMAALTLSPLCLLR